MTEKKRRPRAVYFYAGGRTEFAPTAKTKGVIAGWVENSVM